MELSPIIFFSLLLLRDVVSNKNRNLHFHWALENCQNMPHFINSTFAVFLALKIHKFSQMSELHLSATHKAVTLSSTNQLKHTAPLWPNQMNALVWSVNLSQGRAISFLSGMKTRLWGTEAQQLYCCLTTHWLFSWQNIFPKVVDKVVLNVDDQGPYAVHAIDFFLVKRSVWGYR